MANIILSLRLAWTALMQNKVRSFLTLMGMIIGVGAVIAIVSLGEGLRADFQSQISALGGDVFYMMPKSPKRPGQAPKNPEAFKMSDMDAIAQQCPSVRDVQPSINIDAALKYREKSKQVNVLGVYEDYLETTQTDKLDTGRFFTKSERMNSVRVVVIGADLADELFEKWDEPVGKTVKIAAGNFLIIGKMKKRSGVFAGGPDVNKGFLAPLTTVQKRMIGNQDVYWVSIYLHQGAS